MNQRRGEKLRSILVYVEGLVKIANHPLQRAEE